MMGATQMNEDEDLYWTLIDIANGLLTGTMLGGYYAIISIGLALNFGVMRLVNLAHGDWLIVAAYLCRDLLSLLPVAPFWSLVIVVPLMFGIGYALQRVLLNHVSVAGHGAARAVANFGLMLPLLVTFGLSIVIAQGMLADLRVRMRATIRNELVVLGDPAVRGPEHLDALRFVFFAIASIPGLRCRSS